MRISTGCKQPVGGKSGASSSKKKKKKGTLRTGEVEEQAKGNISFDLCGKQNFQRVMATWPSG